MKKPMTNQLSAFTLVWMLSTTLTLLAYPEIIEDGFEDYEPAYRTDVVFSNRNDTSLVVTYKNIYHNPYVDGASFTGPEKNVHLSRYSTYTDIRGDYQEVKGSLIGLPTMIVEGVVSFEEDGGVLDCPLQGGQFPLAVYYKKQGSYTFDIESDGSSCTVTLVERDTLGD